MIYIIISFYGYFIGHIALLEGIYITWMDHHPTVIGVSCIGCLAEMLRESPLLRTLDWKFGIDTTPMSGVHRGRKRPGRNVRKAFDKVVASMVFPKYGRICINILCNYPFLVDHEEHNRIGLTINVCQYSLRGRHNVGPWILQSPKASMRDKSRW